jgi:sugar (pentulose or hexulose) kinase
VRDRVPPDPASAATMANNYMSYRRVYPALKSIFQ